MELYKVSYFPFIFLILFPPMLFKVRLTEINSLALLDKRGFLTVNIVIMTIIIINIIMAIIITTTTTIIIIIR